MEVSLTSIELVDLIIRKAIEQDLPALEWDGEYSHFRRLFRSLYQSSLKGETNLWIAEMPDAGLIGQIFVQFISSRAEIADGRIRAYLFSFRVKEPYRNLGVGAKILNFIENDLRRHGFQWTVLNVDKKNNGARQFYEKYGYKVVGSEPGIWSYVDQFGQNHDVHEPAWRMEKRLGNGIV
jgi:ribosomal protein S18 acetylase RimI-like enzyme